jgi:conjugative transfer region protein (TIGR03748 family)
MKRSRFNTSIALVYSIFLASMAPQLQANEIQAGRYTTLSATPTKAQADLLATTVMIQFPERILTIGEAVRHLLQRSGYRLASPEASGSDIDSLFALPLPAVHRNLGPMTLQDALETLAGPEFHLVQDTVHRLITFEHCEVDRLDHSNKHRNGGRIK